MKDLMSRVNLACRYFGGSKYQPDLDKILEKFEAGKEITTEELLAKLPSELMLLNQLVEKLENKSVYPTLKKIAEGKAKNNYQALKGLFSLGTHTAIECEKGNIEYRALFPDLCSRIMAMVAKEV